jgi:HD-like signal output (HDOD) protein
MAEVTQLHPEMKPEQRLFTTIYNAFQQGTVKVPGFPETAMALKRLEKQGDPSINELAAVIEKDSAVSGKLVQVANSPAFRAYRRAESVRDAIARLGVSITREVALCLSLADVFKVRSACVRVRMRQLWGHSVEIAALTCVIARDTRGLRADAGLLAGLLHDIGVNAILHYADELGVEDKADLDNAIARFRAPVGELVMEHWEMGESLVEVVRHADNWGYESKDAKPSYVDAVIVAQGMDVNAASWKSRAPAPGDVPAFHRLMLETPAGDDERLPFLQENAEAVLSLCRAFEAA